MMLGIGWIAKGFATLCISMFDLTAYLLTSVAYEIFIAVSKIDLFSTDGALNMYNTFIRNIYNALAIVMVFVFAYYLLLAIIDPDKSDATKKPINLIKNTAISIIAIIVMPFIFSAMATFQYHVLTDDTIPQIVLGTGGGAGDKPGSELAMITYMAFYHPTGSSYGTFFQTEGSENGNLKDKNEAVSACTSGGADAQVCDEWYEALSEWQSKGKMTMAPLTKNSYLRSVISEEGGTEYLWIISTGVALIVAWFFISYAIDIGTRAVKLGVLQILAPIPLIMRIFPQTEGSFKKWRSELIKTYADLFIRLAIISFIIFICTLVPSVVNAVFNAI